MNRPHNFVADKVEYGSAEWEAYQSDGATGANTAVSPVILEMKAILERMLAEKRAEELRKRKTDDVIAWATRLIDS